VLGRRGGNGVLQETQLFVVTWDFPSSPHGHSIDMFPGNSQLSNTNVCSVSSRNLGTKVDRVQD